MHYSFLLFLLFLEVAHFYFSTLPQLHEIYMQLFVIFFQGRFFFFYFGDLYKFSSMPLMYDGVVIACYLFKYVHLLVVADIGWVVVPLEDVLYTSHFSFVYV